MATILADQTREKRVIRSVPFESYRTRDDNNEPIIEGYFAVFNSVYTLWGGATESIAPGAFDNTISGDIKIKKKKKKEQKKKKKKKNRKKKKKINLI